MGDIAKVLENANTSGQSPLERFRVVIFLKSEGSRAWHGLVREGAVLLVEVLPIKLQCNVEGLLLYLEAQVGD